MDLFDVSIEMAIAQGRMKEAADLLRERGGDSGRLFKMLGDLIDPDKLQRMGAPVKTETPEYRAKQDKMMIEYYFLRAYYKAQGRKAPGQLAKYDVIEAHGSNKSIFENGQKRFSRSMMKDIVEIELKCIDEHGLDFPDWIKNYPDK